MNTVHRNDLTDCDNKVIGSRRSLFHVYLGPRIKHFREAIGMTQEEAASEVGYSKNMWSQIETGRSGIVLTKLPRVCEVLKVEEATLQWPSDIPENLLDIVNMLLVVARRKGETPHFNSIESLIRTAYENLPK